MKETKRIIAVGAIVAYVAMAPAPSDAQQTSSSSDASGTIEEVVVTAQRREESINTVPISVTAFSQRTMDDLRIQSLGDLATIVPGLVITAPQTTGQDGPDIAIRGIYSNGNAPTTQIYIDDTPIAIRHFEGGGYSDSPQPQIFDLDRVEVLRGPQGTLFGASAMGGAIRFITPQPDLNNSSGFAKGDFGYTDRGSPNYEVGAAYGGPIVNNEVGFRLSTWYQSNGGFIDQEDPYTGQILQKNINSSDTLVMRGALTWKPTDQLTITPAVYWQKVHTESPNSYWLNALPVTDGDQLYWGGIKQPRSNDFSVSSLNMNYEMPWAAFHSSTSYLNRESNTVDDFTQIVESYWSGGKYILPGLGSDSWPSDDIETTNAWQQEFRLTSTDASSRISWIVGAFYRHSKERMQQLVYNDFGPITEECCHQTSLEFFGQVPDYIFNGQVLNAYENFEGTDVSEALYGDVAVKITQSLKLDLGVRGDHQSLVHQNQVVAGPFNGITYQNVTPPDQSGTPVTPRASLTYQFTDNDMVYVTAAKGYRPGGSNPGSENQDALCDKPLAQLGLTSVPASFGSDSLWSYELGTKDQLFDKRLSIQASVYYIDWTKIQTSVELQGCGIQFTANRGKATSQGADLQVEAIPLTGLRIGILAGYTDAYYPNAEYGTTSGPGQIPKLLIAAGFKIPQVIPWTAAANAEYSRDISSLWADARSYFRLDYRWLDGQTPQSIPAMPDYDPAVTPYANPSYGVLNARVGVKRGGLDLSVYVNNVTNANPDRLGYGDLQPGSLLFSAAAIRPRTTGITAWYHF